jgi:hypothetical protein
VRWHSVDDRVEVVNRFANRSADRPALQHGHRDETREHGPVDRPTEVHRLRAEAVAGGSSRGIANQNCGRDGVPPSGLHQEPTMRDVGDEQCERQNHFVGGALGSMSLNRFEAVGPQPVGHRRRLGHIGEGHNHSRMIGHVLGLCTCCAIRFSAHFACAHTSRSRNCNRKERTVIDAVFRIAW